MNNNDAEKNQEKTQAMTYQAHVEMQDRVRVRSKLKEAAETLISTYLRSPRLAYVLHNIVEAIYALDVKDENWSGPVFKGKEERKL